MSGFPYLRIDLYFLLYQIYQRHVHEFYFRESFGKREKPVPANIEIKARVNNFDVLLTVVAGLAESPVQVLEQEDTFFNTSAGRLKLRISPDNYAELIYYNRTDQSGPKQSEYCLIKIDEPETFKKALGAAIGIRGVVRKTRHLYHVGQTRIHLDEVEALGHFIELEVVLRANQSPSEGEKIANQFMEKLQITEAQLIRGAYIDLMETLSP